GSPVVLQALAAILARTGDRHLRHHVVRHGMDRILPAIRLPQLMDLRGLFLKAKTCDDVAIERSHSADVVRDMGADQVEGPFWRIGHASHHARRHVYTTAD